MKITFVSIGLIAVSVVVVALLTAFPVHLLWNWPMPEIFGLTTLTFWQAFGVSLLAGCLFKGGGSSS